MSATTKSTSGFRDADDEVLIRATLARDERAWRELMRRYEPPLRQALRDTQALDDEQLDDVVGDLWLRLLDDDMERLHTFSGGGGSALAFLTMHAAEVAQARTRREKATPAFVPLDEARAVAAPPNRARPPRNDVSGLAALLQLPDEIHALRAEIAGVRQALDQLRRALPPALLSVGDTARSLGVSEITVRRMIRSGKLAHVRLGRSLKVDLTRVPVESVNATDGIRAVDLCHR